MCVSLALRKPALKFGMMRRGAGRQRYAKIGQRRRWLNLQQKQIQLALKKYIKAPQRVGVAHKYGHFLPSEMQIRQNGA